MTIDLGSAVLLRLSYCHPCCLLNTLSAMALNGNPDSWSHLYGNRPIFTDRRPPLASTWLNLGQFVEESKRANFSLSLAFSSVVWAHASMAARKAGPRLGDERITSGLKGTERLILSPRKQSHLIPPETNNTSPLTTTFKGLQSRTLCIPWRREEAWPEKTRKLAWASKCHL